MMNDVSEYPQNAYSPSIPCGSYRMDNSKIVVHKGMTFRTLRMVHHSKAASIGSTAEGGTSLIVDR